MKIPSDTQDKMMAAYQMLSGQSLSVSSFEQVRTLVKGIHPQIDKKLEICSKALDKIQKIQQMDIISLVAEKLPEDDEKKKKKKKAILFFINCIKDLQSEIKRVQNEFTKQNSQNNTLSSWGKIIKYAKGPFGLVTLAAVIIVAVSISLSKNNVSQMKKIEPSPSSKQSIQVIIFQNKQLPLSQLYIGHGSDCDAPHYHATNGSVIALDGTTIQDPEGCGFGKVANTQVITVQK